MVTVLKVYRCGADALVRAGPLVRLKAEADEGVGRGPGGPAPHADDTSVPYLELTTTWP
jgi:hypothetical protein